MDVQREKLIALQAIRLSTVAYLAYRSQENCDALRDQVVSYHERFEPDTLRTMDNEIPCPECSEPLDELELTLTGICGTHGPHTVRL